MIETRQVFDEALAEFPRKIQSRECRIFLFEFLDDAEALLIVFEAAVFLHQFVEGHLAAVAEWRMTEVVRKTDAFGEIFVQPQSAGDIPRDGGDLHGVGEPGAQMIAGAIEENLGFVLQAAESAGMNYAIAVALKLSAPERLRLAEGSPSRISTTLSVWSERLPLPLLEFLPGTRH